MDSLARRKSMCIIGSGNIGTRHLQGMIHLDYKLNIYVVDTSENSLDNAKKSYESTKGFEKHTIFYLRNISELPINLDIGIIATSSNIRRQVIDQLFCQSKVDYLILEKVLFNEIDDYEYIQKELIERNVKAWVNCPRRIYPSYIKLKKELKNSKQMEISVSGSNWGMACNTIHMLDLIAFLTDDVNLSLSTDLILPQIIHSKREGFYEIGGSISGTMGKFQNYVISTYENELESTPNMIMINCDTAKVIIFEGKEKALIANKLSEWEFVEHEFKIPYQSQIAYIPVAEILNSGKCSLTKYKDSKVLHLAFQIPLVQHFIKLEIGGGTCPIT